MIILTSHPSWGGKLHDRLSHTRITPPVDVSTINREILLDEARVYLVVLTPDCGAGQTVMEGQQMETVGILTVLDLVVGTCLRMQMRSKI